MPTVPHYTEHNKSLPIYINLRVSKYKLFKNVKDIIKILKGCKAII